MDSSEKTKQKKLAGAPGRPALKAAKDRRGGQALKVETLRSAVTHYLIFALIAVVCFSIAAFALEVFPAYEHNRCDYADDGAWTAWFNGPFLAQDLKTVTEKLPAGAQGSYSLTGDLETLSARGKQLQGAKNELRYYLATASADNRLLGTWVASSTFVEGRRQGDTPAIIDQRSARQLRVGVGDTVTLNVKLQDAGNNDVQGNFPVHITAIARPTEQFRGVALVSGAMARFISSAQQVKATDLYVFGGASDTPQKLADALASDQIKGALRSDMVKQNAQTETSRASALRYGIAAFVLLLLGAYVLLEMRFNSASWRVADKDHQYSVRRARRRMLLDVTLCLIILAVMVFAGTALAGALIRTLLTYEPLRSLTLGTTILFLGLAVVLVILRALWAHSLFRKRAPQVQVIEHD